MVLRWVVRLVNSGVESFVPKLGAQSAARQRVQGTSQPAAKLMRRRGARTLIQEES